MGGAPATPGDVVDAFGLACEESTKFENFCILTSSKSPEVSPMYQTDFRDYLCSDGNLEDLEDLGITSDEIKASCGFCGLRAISG